MMYVRDLSTLFGGDLQYVRHVKYLGVFFASLTSSSILLTICRMQAAVL